jgi:hypothetical protein
MAEEDNDQAATRAKILWDDSQMRSAYANVCNVGSTREEVLLMFGMNQAWQGGQDQVKVKLTDRIILSPYAAKRLSVLLNNVLTQYEERYGTLSLRPE